MPFSQLPDSSFLSTIQQNSSSRRLTPAMDSAHHLHQWPAHQGGIGQVKPVGEFASAMAVAITTASAEKPPAERKPRPQKEQALNCPRCNSTNTKFCYYNNYSLTQPRYFCKSCRRYWTEGGSLRDVPVGGGSRKNKRCSSAAINGAPPYKKLPIDLTNIPPSSVSAAAPKFYPSSLAESCSADRGLLAPFPPPEFAAARFGFEEFRPPLPQHQPRLDFRFDAFGGVYGGKTMLFPFEELKPPIVSNNYAAVEHGHQHLEQNKRQSGSGDHPPLFWSSVMNGRGSW